MSQERYYQIVARDATGQKQVRIAVDGETTWAEVTDQAVEGMHLPRSIEQEEQVYHPFLQDTGESLLPSRTVAQTLIQEIEEEWRERQENADAEIRVYPELNPAIRKRRWS